MNFNFPREFYSRIVRAYRQHFPVKDGSGWVEDDTMFFSFNHPQRTLFLRLTPSNPELERKLTINLSSAGNELSVSVDSSGMKWNSPKPQFLTTEELQSFENLASRLYLIALDSVDDLRFLTSTSA